jgi:hypothetical protein
MGQVTPATEKRNRPSISECGDLSTWLTISVPVNGALPTIRLIESTGRWNSIVLGIRFRDNGGNSMADDFI